MSVILDALRKAQEERRRANSRPADSDELSPSKRMHRLYYLSGAVLVLLGITLLVPDVRRALRFGPRIESTQPSVKQKPQAPAAAVSPGAEGTDTRKGTEVAKPELPIEGQGTLPKKTGEEKKLPKLSWAPITKVPIPAGTHGQMSPGVLPVQQPKPTFSGLDQEQSIVVKRAAVRDSAAEMYNKALREMDLGKAEEARRSYLAALAHRPNDAEALNNLGVLVMNGGNTRDALVYFKMALDSRHDYPKAHNNLGMLYLKEGQNRSAEEHLRQALKLEPDNIEPHLNLSALLRSEGRFQEASQLLSGLLNKGCKEPALHLSYAIINDEMGNYPEAIIHYRRYLAQTVQGAERSTVAGRLKVLEGHQSSAHR